MLNAIGRQIAEGAYSGLIGKLDQLFAYLSNQELPDDEKETYERIKTSALKAFNAYIKKGKAHIKSGKFSQNIENITTSTLKGITSASTKFFGISSKKIKTDKKNNPLTGFIHEAQSIFYNIGHIAQKEAKKQLLSFFSEWIVDGIDIALDSFKSKDPDYQELKDKIDKSKQTILLACKEGNLKGILTALKEITKSIEHAPLYFNGIPLIRTSQIEDSAIFKGIANSKALKELTKKNNSKQEENFVTIKRELKALAKNLTIQNTFTIIFATILDENLPPLESVFETPRLHIASENLHKLISQSNSSIIRKWIAHISVSIIMHFFYYVLIYAFRQLEKKINRFIDDKLDHSLNFSIIASLFSRLNAAHLSIKDRKNYFGTIDELVTKNMEQQQSLSSISLYEKVQTKFLNEFSLKLPITSIFWKKIWQINFHQTPLNILIFPLKGTIACIFWIIFIIPELIINYILSYTLRISFFWKKTLPNLILKSLTSFADYTKSVHPINVMMVNYLQKIWDELKSSYSEKEDSIDHTTNLSPSTKQSLDLTLKHLFELLEKTPFETPEQLSYYLEGSSPIEKTKIIASRFFLSQNLSAFTNMIAQAIKIMISKDSKQKLITQALMGINQGFCKKQTLTIKEMGQTEEKINILLSQILSLTIRKTIEHRYNFTPKNQIEATEHFFKEIQEKTLKTCKEWALVIQNLSLKDDPAQLAIKLEQYCDFIQNKQLEIRSNPDLSKNPRALINQLYCEPLQEKISEITKAIETLSFIKKIDTDENLVQIQLQKLAKIKLSQIDDVPNLINQAYLIYQTSDLSHQMQPLLGKIYKNIQSYPLIEKLKINLKTLQHSSSNKEFMEKLALIIESVDEEQDLSIKLKVFQTLSKSYSFEELQERLLGLITEFQTNQNLCELQISQDASDILEKFKPKEFKSFIKQDAKKAVWKQASLVLLAHVEELAKLAHNFKPIKHYNIKLISTDDALELMQNFAYNSMIGPMEQLLKLIKKPYIWQYGIVNPLCQEFLE